MRQQGSTNALKEHMHAGKGMHSRESRRSSTDIRCKLGTPYQEHKTLRCSAVDVLGFFASARGNLDRELANPLSRGVQSRPGRYCLDVLDTEEISRMVQWDVNDRERRGMWVSRSEMLRVEILTHEGKIVERCAAR